MRIERSSTIDADGVRAATEPDVVPVLIAFTLWLSRFTLSSQEGQASKAMSQRIMSGAWHRTGTRGARLNRTGVDPCQGLCTNRHAFGTKLGSEAAASKGKETWCDAGLRLNLSADRAIVSAMARAVEKPIFLTTVFARSHAR